MLFSISKINATAAYHYVVHIPEQLDHFSVELCFSSSLPDAMYLPDETAKDNFQALQLVRQHKSFPVRRSNRRLDLNDARQGDCLRYRAVFNGKVTHPWFKQRQSRHEQILVSLNQWMLQLPEKYQTSVTIDFHLPVGFEVSAPGKLISTSQDTRVYQFRARPSNWEGRIAVGRFDKVIKRDNGSRIEISILRARKKIDQEKIIKWIDKNIETLQQIYAQFPVKDLQIIVVPVNSDREPVSWGQVMRGGGDAVHLYIDQTRSYDEFKDDWVLIHELGHLLHPRISDNGNWFSEGLASYYQHVLRARTGMLTREQAWNKLNAGFERGLRGTSPNRTLAQVTETMMRDRSFMRVYWSGAAISFLADTQLRDASRNQQSLDTVLQKYKQCCLPVDRAWTAFELMQKYDQLSNSIIFTELYKQNVDSTKFPDLSNTYKKLGLRRNSSQLEIMPAAPWIKIRRDIMQTRK